MQRRALGLLGALLAATPPPGEGAPDPLHADPQFAAPATLALLRRLFAEAMAAPETGAALDQRRWAAVALVRLGGGEASGGAGPVATVTALIRDGQATAEQRLAGALALAGLPVCQSLGQRPIGAQAPNRLDCVALWIEALPDALTLQERERVRPLLELLGRSRDGRARLPLEQQLETVLSRPDLVAALGSLGDPAAVPTLARLLREDPYVHVREAAALALGRLGGEAARTALQSAAAREREAPVQSAIATALAGSAASPL